MNKRRTGRIVVGTIVVLGAMVVVGSVATGKLSLLTQAWGTFSDSVAASLSSDPAPSSRTADADAPRRVDAAATVHRQTAPLSSAQLGAPLVHGTFVSACGAPDDMKVVVDVTVKMGRAVQVTVKTQPPNPTVASCVDRATRDLQWDVSPKTDHATVTY
jgi:hypothetical protein